MTGVRSADAITHDLFQDSLLFLDKLPRGPLIIADIGAGPGIPGVPLRIIRHEISLTLIEAKRRSVSFLASLKRELDLPDIVVLEGRAEQLLARDPDLRCKFDAVVTRAVGPHLLPIAMEYLKPGGLFVAGASPAQELGRQIGATFAVSLETSVFKAFGLDRTFLVGRKST